MLFGVDDPTLSAVKVDRSDAFVNLGRLSNLEKFSHELISVAKNRVPQGNSPVSYDIKLLFDKVPRYIEHFRSEYRDNLHVAARTDRLYVHVTKARSDHFFEGGSADLSNIDALHEYAHSVVAIAEYVIAHGYGIIGVYIHDLVQIASNHLSKMDDATSIALKERITRVGEEMFDTGQGHHKNFL